MKFKLNWPVVSEGKMYKTVDGRRPGAGVITILLARP